MNIPPSVRHRNKSHIHTVHDGRGPRHVFLNGEKIKNCVLAVEGKRGMVQFHDDPQRRDPLNPGEIITHTLYGEVRVEFIP